MAVPRLSLSLGSCNAPRRSQALARPSPQLQTSSTGAPLVSRRPYCKRTRPTLRASAEEGEAEKVDDAASAAEGTAADVTTSARKIDDTGGSMAGKFFGTYLQLGVWVVVLSYAAIRGISIANTDPDAVGLLIAPPAAAAVLIGSFLFWRFVLNKDEFSG